VAEPLEAAAAPGGEWRAEAVTLYRSTLRRQGAVYDALERVVLGA
jgi:2'-5' RNA ligase